MIELPKKILREHSKEKEVKPHFKDEWDAIEWELEHPSKELCDAAKQLDDTCKNYDWTKMKSESYTLKS